MNKIPINVFSVQQNLNACSLIGMVEAQCTARLFSIAQNVDVAYLFHYAFFIQQSAFVTVLAEKKEKHVAILVDLT
jgi:hypothetical protein